MLKTDFLKKLGLYSSAAAMGLWSAISRTDKPASAAESESDNWLTGLWQMEATGKLGTYKYLYAFSENAYTCTGNIDAGFQQFAYSPTLGTYEPTGSTAYKFLEMGWAFDRKGTNVGSFQSKGSFHVNASRTSLSGTGTFVQHDLRGKEVFVEPFTATARRISA